MYNRLTSATAVTTSQALKEFHERQASAGGPQPGEPGGNPISTTSASPTPTVASPTATGKPTATPTCDWACPASFTAPDAGVYEWITCAFEAEKKQCTGRSDEDEATESFGPGVTRPIPHEGQRIVTLKTPTLWTARHLYSEEHIEELDLMVDPTGVYMKRYLVDFDVPPVANPEPSEIKQNPPMKSVIFPTAAGQKWSGHWADDNKEADADYAAEVLAKEELTIGGRKLRTWVIEIRMNFLGPKTTGVAVVRLWVAPDVRQTVQERYDESLNHEGQAYTAKWMTTMKSTKPQS